MLRRGARPEQGVRPVDADGRREGDRLPPDPKFCDEYHAADPAFWKRVYYWKTPLRRLRQRHDGDDCKDYNDWVKAWTEIKG